MAGLQPIIGAQHLGSTDDTCPECGTTLDAYSLHAIKFDGCPNCHGVWLVKDELRRLKNKFDVGQLHWLNAEVDAIGKAVAIPSAAVCPTHDGGQLLSVRFGKSSVIVDWCPKCHGLWLKHDEFYKVIDYLARELGDASVKDVEHEIARDMKSIVTGEGPESRAAEIRDIAAAIHALINFTIFEHPAVMRFIIDAQGAGRSGMD
ncbi:MAG: zf-TFIIB domain-containing protein [Verrucomicrobia bacterium]|nr:zf-TFIIB domain-containing protein [Verrucomicrobiota bacterium]